jgi:hypothetical protein
MGWCSHNTLDLYFRNACFEYWLGLQLYWHIVVVFLSPSQENSGIIPSLYHNHYVLFYHWILYSFWYWHCHKIIRKKNRNLPQDFLVSGVWFFIFCGCKRSTCSRWCWDFMLFILCIFIQFIHQPTYALNKIQFMTSIKLLHVSALGCHHQELFRTKEYKPNTLIWVLYCL